MADDKPKKIGAGGKKIGGVKRSGQADQVRKSEAVVGPGQVKKAGGVGSVSGAGASGKRRPTRLMSLAEREKYFDMVKEDKAIIEEEAVVIKFIFRQLIT